LVQGIEKYNLGILTEVYGIEYRSPPEFIEKFAEKRHRRKKGGGLDIEAGASILMNENIQGEIRIWKNLETYLKEKKEQEEKR